jgi:hypothetical protein
MPTPTVRIPELSPLTAGLDLDLADQLPIYIASENKTKKVTLQSLNTFFATGGGETHPPAVYLGEMVYVVDAAAAGTDTASITSLAGKEFTLERSGYPLIPLLPDGSNSAIAEYEILNSGGFKLLNGYTLGAVGERYKLTIYSLIGTGGGGGGGSTTTYASFIRGKKNVGSNTVLDPVTDINKIIQVRGSSSSYTQTLPNVGDVAANSLIVIESIVGNTAAQKIATTGGQYIYLNNVQKTEIWLHPGEIVWLFRDDDGYYVINDFADQYKNLARPMAAYKAELNQLVCKGQLVSRTTYPRLWEYVNGLGASLVSDATWSTATATVAGRTVDRPYRGCFSTGDGSTTFRLPDLMNVALRGVKAETGTDANRHLNKPGGYQDDATETHDHSLQYYRNDAQGGGQQYVYYLNNDNGPTALPDGAYKTAPSGSSDETRMENVGVLWVINY